MTKLKIGIIGCGLIGQKRAKALGIRGQLVAAADLDIQRAENLSKLSHSMVKVYKNWKDLIELSEINIVIVSTLHDSLAEITKYALENNKHVLVEKPAARFPEELDSLIELANKKNLKVHVGFNHRYHRALIKAKSLVSNGEIGELMFIRARYGHGARVGYDREWRSNPKLSGGGELIDQGPHLIDLSRWFLGDFTDISGFATTYFWDMPVDDNGFMILKTSNHQVAFLHASCTEWKNLFSMEIYGKIGKIEITGLGGSYGVEKITFFKMLPEMGPPETTCWEYPMGDNSWEVEMDEFYDDISLNRQVSAGLNDAKAALLIIDQIYKDSGYDHRT
jgi:predicted dehydrogenase